MPLTLHGWQRAWSVDGFAALRILEMENGLHIVEDGGLGETASLSEDVVRRYRELPAPLVRDRRRNFRAGRLDLVLAGHFDLMNAA